MMSVGGLGRWRSGVALEGWAGKFFEGAQVLSVTEPVRDLRDNQLFGVGNTPISLHLTCPYFIPNYPFLYAVFARTVFIN